MFLGSIEITNSIKMLKKLKAIIFMGFLCIPFGLMYSHANQHQSCKWDGSLEDKLCIEKERERKDDVYRFIYCYEIITGIHARYVKEFGQMPPALQEDLLEAFMSYHELENYLGSHDEAKRWNDSKEGDPKFHLNVWKEEYNKEMNDEFGLNLSPTSDEYCCHTSYKEAMREIRRILKKYRERT